MKNFQDKKCDLDWVAIKVNTILSKTFFLCEIDRAELVRKRQERLATGPGKYLV